MKTYAQRLRDTLSPAERRVFAKLSTPKKIQDFLDTLPVNFEGGEKILSPRRVLRTGKAHCIEGALLAAAALAYHGASPLLLDFQTIPADEDHVIAVFKQNGLWGAISKTNHSVIRWRDPVYRSTRELAMSYFHEYLMWNGKKSLRAFSTKPFDLSRYKPERWVTTDKDLGWLAGDLDWAPHSPAVPKKSLAHLRKASSIELSAMKLTEWKKSKKKKIASMFSVLKN